MQAKDAVLKKKCNCCKRFKLASEFHRSIRNKDGLFPYCKMCVKKQTAHYRKNNPAFKERKRIRYEKHQQLMKEDPEYAKKTLIYNRASQKKWIEKHREKFNEKRIIPLSVQIKHRMAKRKGTVRTLEGRIKYIKTLLKEDREELKLIKGK